MWLSSGGEKYQCFMVLKFKFYCLAQLEILWKLVESSLGNRTQCFLWWTSNVNQVLGMKLCDQSLTSESFLTELRKALHKAF